MGTLAWVVVACWILAFISAAPGDRQNAVNGWLAVANFVGLALAIVVLA